MSRPWMKFYPRDWRSDSRLRMCSLAARGLWADLIGYMHEAEPYGHLLIGGQKPTTENIARLIGVPLREVVKAMDELTEHGVCSVTEDGTLYSRRMVRDGDRSEEGRRQIEKRWGDKKPNKGPNRSPTNEPTSEPITQKPDTREDGGGGHAREAPNVRPLVGEDAMKIATEVAVICGYPTPMDWPPAWCGAPMRVQAYLDHGWRGEIMLVAARETIANKRDGPPDRITYFERPFARAHARQAAPLPVVEISGTGHGSTFEIPRSGGGQGRPARGRGFAAYALEQARAARQT